MTFWLDDDRGALVDWITQKWVVLTGRSYAPAEFPWLDAPTGKPQGIGADFYETFAAGNGLSVASGAGLLADFRILHGRAFDAGSVHPQIVDFYERTSAYEMDVWSEWCSFFRPFGFALSYLFSRRLQQLNVPLSALDTVEGVKSKILKLRDGDAVRYTAWVREIVRTKNVIYAGNYSTVFLPNYDGLCVKVAFPLPNGNALVVMRPEALPDGSFRVTSSGKKFGDPGFYFTLRDRQGRWHARYVPSFRESIHVYVSDRLHADHVLTLFGLKVLHIHYKLKLI